MKVLKKILRISRLPLFLIVISAMVYSCATIPKLSKEEKQIINDVVKAPIPEIIKGETGFAQSFGHSIWYEKINSETALKGTVVLIMGNGQDALSWPPDFISNFTKAGYEVIRFDHRETGLSESEKKWKKKNPYSLRDMADDVIAIIKKTSTKNAHLVGVSMGGMIAQIVAIENPEKVASLTSIMASGDIFDADLDPLSESVLPQMISAVLQKGFLGSKKGQIKRQIIQKRILMAEATGTIDVKTIAEIANYNLTKREGYNLLAAKHHHVAMLNSESRLDQLQKLTIPTLIIHGVIDPVIPISHGKKLAAIIPNAERMWINNMGHDLPESKINEMTETIVFHLDDSTN